MEPIYWVPAERIKLAISVEFEVALLIAREKVFDWIKSQEDLLELPNQIHVWEDISSELTSNIKEIAEWGMGQLGMVNADTGLLEHNKAFSPWIKKENNYSDISERAMFDALQNRRNYLPPLSETIWKVENKRNALAGKLFSIMRDLPIEDITTNNMLGVFEIMFSAKKESALWMSKRLYRMTPRQRLKSREGLIPPGSRGMSYVHIRLARTEIAALNLEMTKNRYKEEPWVEKAIWTLSPGHPRSDICDSLAAGSPYALSRVPRLPHPNCLCVITPKIMGKRKFSNRVNGWAKGKNNFLDKYSEFMGGVSLEDELRLSGELNSWLNDRVVDESNLGFRSMLSNSVFSKKVAETRVSTAMWTRLKTSESRSGLVSG